MQIASYLKNDIAPCALQDRMKKVFDYFQSNTYTHIPLVMDDKLIGNISENDLQGFKKNVNIEHYLYAIEVFFVRQKTNWVNVLHVFSKNETNIMPVLDENDKYIGYYDLVDIMTFFRETPFLKEPGGIIIIEKGIRDYSFSEISRIVESNNGKLLGSFISDHKEDTIEITLKIGSTGLNEIMQTFRRYSYMILFGNEKDSYIETLKARSAYLNKYLNI